MKNLGNSLVQRLGLGKKSSIPAWDRQRLYNFFNFALLVFPYPLIIYD